MTSAPDQAERNRVLDVGASFIVRAPAGSGKTELLMQRFLALLTTVDEPEEILAITFTRKAAAEMRRRILGAIWPARGAKAALPETQALAARVREVNAARGWQLEQFPARLRIRTIDSVNAWLTASAPATGEGTAQGGVSDDNRALYELAARRVLHSVVEDEEPGPSLRLLLAHLDNQSARFIALLAEMLERREQWLGLFGAGDAPPGLRTALESCLRELVDRELQALAGQLPPELLAGLCDSTRDAAERADANDPLRAWLATEGVPDLTADQLTLWQVFGRQWLTRNGSWRKRLDVNCGFPPDADAKAVAVKRLEQARAFTEAAEQLAVVRDLPPPHYSEVQWEALAALIRVLPRAAAELLLVFRERGETDYAQVAREALEALRSETGPSALALRLDYSIRHILIDEFQDTSFSQYDLLLALTAGWSADGQRTVFVVGDPMQSIYRFRQAEVGLFLKLWESGRIDQVPLERVELRANFRSDGAVIDWVNRVFSALLPPVSDPLTGKVRYSPSVTALPPDENAGVELHPMVLPARVDEAQEVADIVEATLRDNAEHTIGILLRTRRQARLIVPELRRRGIKFRGTGLDEPGHSSVEQDLLALTRALTHFGDRVAWLAVLRAPWCGLSLDDLERLCGDDRKATVWQLMQADDLGSRLSADGAQRIGALAETLRAVFARRGCQPLRDWVEGAWQQLGGAAGLRDEHDLTRIEHVLAVIDRHEQATGLGEAFRLHEQLGERTDRAVDPDVRVEIMTMHKAKGLQFDTVILPGLDGATAGNAKRLLTWHELPRPEGESAYLLAPIEPRGDDPDPLQALVARFQREQEAAEQDRLLYVATTRARRRLHLFFGLAPSTQGGFNKPRSGSLLARLWPVIESEIEGFGGEPGSREAREEWVQPPARRYPPGHPVVSPPAGVEAVAAPGRRREEREITFDWATATAAKTGTVVHRLLQQLAEAGASTWHPEAGRELAARMLAEEGLPKSLLAGAVDRVIMAVERTLADERGRWLLSGMHRESAAELAVTLVVDGEPRRMVIDRTFIDETGVRWIVDYKVSPHEGGDLEHFLAEQKRRYAEQLAGYRQALAALEPDRVVRVALYFPLQGVFSPYEDI